MYEYQNVVLQAQEVSVKGHIKGDLLEAIACIPHTGVYGIEVHCCLALCNHILSVSLDWHLKHLSLLCC